MRLNPVGTHLYIDLKFPCQQKGEKSPVVILAIPSEEMLRTTGGCSAS